ncbi:MAG: AMP-binding protein [Saprospiraceae bacterium]|nr:AMP-binding protein [Saprospiraceae bacterium]
MRPIPYQEKTILDYFYQWEVEKPNDLFLRQPYGETWKNTSWAEAGQIVRKLAAALQGIGLQSGDVISIYSKNCYHWILADLAIMMGGFVSAPLYPNLTGAQLGKVLSLSGAKALFIGKLDDWSDQPDHIPEQVKTIAFPHYPGNADADTQFHWNEILASANPLTDQPRRKLDELWTILFTSGTTGTPKGVMHNFSSPTRLMNMEREHKKLSIFTGDTHSFFSFLPLNHIAERIIVEVAALMTGGTITFAESIDTFARNLQDTQPTLFMAVPRIWTKFQGGVFAKIPPGVLNILFYIPGLAGIIKKKIIHGMGLSRARIALTGAAPTPDGLKNWYKKLGIRLQEVYAMTENCGGCTLMPPDDIRSGTVGCALPDVEIRIEPETGEVIMKAPWNMQGYFQDEEHTRMVIQDGWLYTGDRGTLTEDGFLRLTGRVSDAFKSTKGKFIVPAPMEWPFAEHALIEQVCVTGRTLPQPIALVILSEWGARQPRQETNKIIETIWAEVNASLSSYQQLKRIVIVSDQWGVDNNLLTPTLKIRRNAIHDKYAPYFKGWYQDDHLVVWAPAVKDMN